MAFHRGEFRAFLIRESVARDTLEEDSISRPTDSLRGTQFSTVTRPYTLPQVGSKPSIDA